MAVILLFPLVGAAMSRLLGRTSWFLMGLGTTGLALYVMTLLRVPIVGTVAALAMISVGVLVWGGVEKPAAGGAPLCAVEKPAARNGGAPLVLALLPVGVLLFTTAITPLNDYDGRAFWLLKAKAIAHERQIDGPFFNDRTVYNPRNEYPLMMPLDAAAAMMVSRSSDDRHVRWIYVLTFGALILHIARHAGAWTAALVAWIPQFAVAGDGGAITAYNDIAVAAFAAAAFFERESPLRFGFWLSFLALTKNEGLPFALVLLVAGAFVFRRRVLIALAPLSVAIATLLVWRWRIPRGDEEDQFRLLLNLPDHLDRLIPAALRFFSHMLRLELWGVFWIAVMAASVFVVWRSGWREVARPLLLMAAMSGVYLAVYSVTTWAVNDLIDSSANRLLVHLAGPAVSIISSCARSR